MATAVSIRAVFVCAILWGPGPGPGTGRPVDAANVLAFTLHNARSHFVAFEPLLVRLMQAGHNVTVVGHVRPRATPAGAACRFVALSDGSPAAGGGVVGRVHIPAAARTPFAGLRTLRTLSTRYAQFVRNAELRRLADGEQRFDLVIADTFVSRLALAFVDKLRAPFILVSSTDLFPHTACNLATCLNPAHELWPHSGLVDLTAFARR